MPACPPDCCRYEKVDEEGMLRGVFYDGSEAGLCRVVVTGGQGAGGVLAAQG